MFHGSYMKDDVTFLLQEIELEETPLALKESMVKSGEFHYSELISPEYRPSRAYMQLFQEAMEKNLEKMTRHLLALADHIAGLQKPVIASLARAGTPVGVVLRRMLDRYHNIEATHYSFSIIKGRGVDENALAYMRNTHPDGSLVFVDGWMSKGSINREFKSAISDVNRRYNWHLDDALHVISDLSGSAEVAATHDDYLIPSSILNSTVSGLISRTIFNAQVSRAGGFHGCKFYSELTDIDLSLWYVDKVMEVAASLGGQPGCQVITGGDLGLRQGLGKFITEYCSQNAVGNTEMLKIGIGEATRALLRRVPRAVIVKDEGLDELRHIILLSSERGVDVRIDPSLPFKVLADLESLNHRKRSCNI